MSGNIIKSKSFDFALKVVKITQDIMKNKKEYVMSRQLLRSATSVGANVRESVYAQSKADFISKMSIALKEANETDYWLDLVFHASLLDEINYKALKSDIDEIISILVAIVKSSKNLRMKN